MKILKALNITPTGAVLNALFFAGLIIQLWDFKIYQKTFIDYRILLGVWIGFGLCLTPALRKILALHINTHSLFLQMVYNIVTWGSIAILIILAPNFYFTQPGGALQLLKVNDTGSLAKGSGTCRTPYVVVDWRAIEKQITFPCGTPVDKAGWLKVELKKGMLGYDVISEKKLILTR